MTHERPDPAEARRLYEATLAALIPIWEEHQKTSWNRTWYVGDESPLALMAIALERVVSIRASRGKRYPAARMLAIRTRNYLGSASRSIHRASAICAGELARRQSPCVSLHADLGDGSSWFVIGHPGTLATRLAQLYAHPNDGAHIRTLLGGVEKEYRRLLTDPDYCARVTGSKRRAA